MPSILSTRRKICPRARHRTRPRRTWCDARSKSPRKSRSCCWRRRLAGTAGESLACDSAHHTAQCHSMSQCSIFESEAIHTWCPSTGPEHDYRWALMWTHRFFKDPPQNSCTEVGVYISGTQCLNTAPSCAGAQALVLGHQVWTCLERREKRKQEILQSRRTRLARCRCKNKQTNKQQNNWIGFLAAVLHERYFQCDHCRKSPV